jgi:hypothetical protein
LAIAEKLGLEPSRANSLCDLGFAELGAGRPERAHVRFGEALESSVRLGWKENVAYCLAGVGAIAVDAGQLDSAGHVLGQAELLVDDLHLKLESYAEAARAHAETELRSRLGEDRLDALRAEGRSLSIEDAVSEALAALD